MRLTGILVGLGSFLPDMKNCRIVRLDGDGELGPSFEAVRKHLRSSRARRQLVGAINDPSALGALRAFQEAGRSECCAVMGHNASPEGRAELRQPETRLLGSVAFFPERYGGDLIREKSDRAKERSEEHTSELQSLTNLVCRLLLEKKKKTTAKKNRTTT